MSSETANPAVIEAVRECVFMRGADGTILVLTPPWAHEVRRQMRDSEMMASRPGYFASLQNSTP